MTTSAPHLDLKDVQGDILRAFGNTYTLASYVFVEIGDAPEGRRWLGQTAKRVTSAEEWSGAKPATAVTLAVTYAGIGALGGADPLRETFPQEFRQGMAARADMLGDTAESDPARWERGLGTGTAHVLVTVNAQSRPALEGELRRLRDEVERARAKIVYEQHAEMLATAREHFGYADGFAQPSVEGTALADRAGGGVPLKGSGSRPVKAGELVLGYEDEDHGLPEAPGEPFHRNATFMVWRKLHQDVALYRRTLREAAARYPHGDEAMLAAKIVGRWRNGTPVVMSPDREDPVFDPQHPGSNDFRYADDLDGMRCPLGAHVRRSNPRDALGWDGAMSMRHRIVRRGMPYGPPLPEGVEEDDGTDRGLVFVCFNASIARQFEAIQIEWLNDGDVFGLGRDRDYLLGDPSDSGKMTVNGRPPFFLSPQPSFVTTRGGEYLYVPSRSGLRALAEGVG